MSLLHKFRGVLSKQVIRHLTLTQREWSMGKGSLILPTDQSLMKACDLVKKQKIVEKNSWPHYDMYKCEIRLAIKDCLYLKISMLMFWAEDEPQNKFIFIMTWSCNGIDKGELRPFSYFDSNIKWHMNCIVMI